MDKKETNFENTEETVKGGMEKISKIVKESGKSILDVIVADLVAFASDYWEYVVTDIEYRLLRGVRNAEQRLREKRRQAESRDNTRRSSEDSNSENTEV